MNFKVSDGMSKMPEFDLPLCHETLFDPYHNSWAGMLDFFQSQILQVYTEKKKHGKLPNTRI